MLELRVALDPSGFVPSEKVGVPVPPEIEGVAVESARPFVVMIEFPPVAVTQSFTVKVTLIVALDPRESVAVTDSL